MSRHIEDLLKHNNLCRDKRQSLQLVMSRHSKTLSWQSLTRDFVASFVVFGGYISQRWEKSSKHEERSCSSEL